MLRKWRFIKPYVDLGIVVLMVGCFAKIWRLMDDWILLCAAMTALLTAGRSIEELRRRRREGAAS